MSLIRTDLKIKSVLESPTKVELLKQCKTVSIGESILIRTPKLTLQFYVERGLDKDKKENKQYKLMILDISLTRLEKILVFTKIEGMYKGGFDNYLMECNGVLGLL